MATQGILSVVQGDKVLLKFVAGCNGSAVVNLAENIRQLDVQDLDLDSLYDLALDCHVGCLNCLVVLSPDDENYCSDDIEFLKDDYRATFNNPKWNPRWKYGTADYVEIVRVGQ